MKYIVAVLVGIVSFLVTFSLISKDEIATGVDERLDEDFVAQCVARSSFPAPLQAKAPQICGCMKSEFDTRGLKLTDAFGDKRAEMQRITQSCARVYS